MPTPPELLLEPIRFQRNTALDSCAELLAGLAMLQAQIQEKDARIAELEKLAQPPPPPAA